MGQAGHVRHVLPLVIALGVAGFDPLGALALIGAMALQARRRAIAALLASTLGSTFLLAVVLSSTVGRWVIDSLQKVHDPGHLVWGGLVTAAGVALLGWGLWRLRGPVRPRRTKTERTVASSAALALIGLGVGLSALIDPAFYGLVVLAGDLRSWWGRLAACLVWVLVSQIALVVLSIAVFAGVFDKALRLIERARRDWAARLSVLASWTLVVVGVLMAAEGIAEICGRWLLP